MRHFCTYFDHRYLARALALNASLRRHSGPYVLWALCLSDECEALLRAIQPESIRIVPLRELESFDPQLAQTREHRSVAEYYFTCSPCLPRYLFQRSPEIDAITYLDADLFFYSSPESVFDEIGDGDVAVVPHRYSPVLAASLSRFGRFNVGWLTFRRSSAGLQALAWWRERCLEWCFDRVEGDRYADQKYLEAFPQRFPTTHVIAHPGANLAPWNVDGHNVAFADDRVLVDGRPLVFFHFQGLREIAAGWFDSNFSRYRATLTATLKTHVFRVYLRELAASETVAGLRTARVGTARTIRGASSRLSPLATVARAVAIGKAAFRGHLVRM